MKEGSDGSVNGTKMAKTKEKAPMTPMMKQFFSFKAQCPEAVLLFRCGDFYETYAEEDAMSVSGSTWIPYAYVTDHRGDVREIVDLGAGTVVERNDYYSYGMRITKPYSSATDFPQLSANRWRLSGKEEQASVTGIGSLDFGARHYDPFVSRWLSPDPLMEKYYGMSPYVYCMNNPNLFIDFFGSNPVYNLEGSFLGTDELGLNGDWLVMDEELFYQGMLHVDAANLSVVPPSKKTVEKITRHFNSLSTRPDFDGVVTIIEGVNWAKQHPYALSEPTPDNTLYIDSSKLNFGYLSTSDFSDCYEIENVNLFNFKNLSASMNKRIRGTVYALGLVSIELVDRESRTVRIVNDNATDYDWNEGGSIIRNSFIKVNNSVFRIDPEKHGFKVFYYGIGRLNK